MSEYFSKSNTGGAIASRGFEYQDYCSLIELFQVVDGDTFRAISIETLDDFTIFINNIEILYQVKKMQFNVKIINEVLEKDIGNREQRFIFTSKDSVKYNGLFDKIIEYNQSKISSRTDNEKEVIKHKIKKIVEKSKIDNSEKYLSSMVLIYEESNIDDILYTKFRRWLDLKDFDILKKDDFLDKVRLTISDKKGSRAEFKKEEFYNIVDNFKSNKNQIEPREKSVTISVREARGILKQVAKYLNENNKTIITDIIYLLETNQEKSYIDDLKENKENFIESIKGDFAYMEDYANTPNTRDKKLNKDDPKYKKIYIVSSLQLAYCDFYQEFSKQIKTLEKGKAVKSRLDKLSIALQKKYKCKNVNKYIS